MKIHGICVVKNEADIIRETLKSALSWCDSIYVLDNGSQDGTWGIVKDLALTNPSIVPHRQDDRPFNVSLRGEVFNAFRGNASNGDWWCRLDADEVYYASPRSFLLKHGKHCEVVWAIHLQYYFTDEDLRAWKTDPSNYSETRPLTERYRYYIANASEARFFKHRDRLEWKTGAWPRHMGRVCRHRLLLRHYQYREPGQMKLRLATRLGARQCGCDTFKHVTATDWQTLVRSSGSCHLDSGDGSFVIDTSKLPRHVDPNWKRAFKHFMHGTGLWP